jgi:hypothetical protein
MEAEQIINQSNQPPAPVGPPFGDVNTNVSDQSSSQPQPEVNQVPVDAVKSPKPKRKIFRIIKKLVIILILITILFGGLAAALMYLKPQGLNIPGILPSPTPTAESTPSVIAPSEYADDEDMLKIKSDIDSLDQDLRGDIREDTLRVPTLEWNVNFK